MLNTSTTTGGLFSYTGSPASTSNPIFYIQPGGSDFAPGTLTLKIQNNTGNVINRFDISYNLYVRNDQARSSSFNFSYSTDNINYTNISGLDYTSTTTLDANGLVLVGSSPSRSTTISSLNIADGSYLYIRWSSSDVAGSGSRDEFGLDDIKVTGTVSEIISTPTTQTSSISFSNVTTSGLQLDWTNGNGSSRAIFVKEGSGSITNPVDGTTYTASSNWSSKGTQLGSSGYYCVYNGTGTSVTLSNLAAGTSYYVQAFEYNGSASTSKYYTATATNNPNSATTTSSGSSAPALTADITSNTVDNNIDITFTDDATWRGNVSAVKIGGTALTLTTDYVLSEGNLQLKPSGGNALLTTSGTKAITVEASGYADASVSQTINAGAANKLIVKTQPAAPGANGGALNTQPEVYIRDQYGNATTSTASVTAAVGVGTWSIGGTTEVAATAGTVTFSGLTATSSAAVTGATISFSSAGLTGISSDAFNIPSPPAPTLTAAISPTVDAAFDITFTDNPSWRSAITGITVNSTTLDPSAYSVSAGTITFTPSASVLLQSSGSKSIVVSATGFANSTATQAILAGAATQLIVKTQPAAPASNGAVLGTQPAVYIKDQYGNTTGSTATVTASVGAGTWTIGGTVDISAVAGTATFTDLTATAATSVTGATISYACGALTGTTSAVFDIPAPSPTITVTSMDGFGSVTVNTTSGELSYNVSAANLTEALIITPPVGFQVSTTSGSGFVSNPSTLNITPTEGSITSTTIYVKFSPTTVQTYSANISHTSAGATTKNVAVNGTATAAATPTATVANDVTNSSFTAKWEAVSGASGYKLDVSTTNFTTTTTSFGFEGSTSFPTDWTQNSSYVQNSAGIAHGGTYYAGMNTTGDYFYTTQLSSPTIIKFWVEASSSSANNTTKIQYSSDANSWTDIITYSANGSNSGTINDVWQQKTINVNLTGNQYIRWYTSARSAGSAYFDDIEITTSNSNILSSYSDLDVSGTSHLVDGLSANTTYYYRLRSVGGGSTSANSNTITVLTLPSAPTATEETNASASGFTATWTLPAGGATSYSLDVSENIDFSSYVSGYENLTVTGTSQVVSGLSPNTTYYYRVKANNASGTSTSTTITATTNNAIPVSSSVNVSTLPVCNTCDLIVADGATLTVNENRTFATASVSPTGQLTNSGNTLTLGSLTLNSDATGTATFVDNGTTTVSSATIEQYLPSSRNWYMSAPLSNAKALAGYTYYQYNEPNGSLGTNWTSPAVDDVLVAGRGYIVKPTAEDTYSFTTNSNTLNTGNIEITISRTDGVLKAGFNLIGNPYPSYLNIDNLVNSNVEASYWLRTRNAAGNGWTFDTYNVPSTLSTGNSGKSVTKYIAPMQSFWLRVKSSSTPATLTFTNAMRAHKDEINNRFRAPEIDAQKVLRLEVSNNLNADQTLIYFNSKASNNLDSYDSPKMLNDIASVPEIYTQIGSEKIAINGMKDLVLDQEIPLTFSSGESNTFNIRVTEFKNFDSQIHVILKDRLNVENSEFDLTTDGNYSFVSDAISTANRFSIIFRNSSITTGLDKKQPADNGAIVYCNDQNNLFIICNNSMIKNAIAIVYNAVGQKLKTQQITGTTTIIEERLSSGVYFVKISTNGKSITQKVVIK